MRPMLWVTLVVFMTCLARAETTFTFDESRDKLTDAMTRKLIIVAEDGKSTVELRQSDGTEKLTVFIDPASVIFPDQVADGEMAVSVTMRSSVMKEPATVRCEMNFMKYDFCYITLSPRAARMLFTGEHLTMQMAKTADRMTFPVGGKEYEDALNKVLLPAEKLMAAKKERDAEEQKRVLREKEEESAKQAQQEQERMAREAAEKPLRDGRAAGLELAAKLGKKAHELGRSGIMLRAKTAVKKSGYEGKDAEIFIEGYVGAIDGAGQ